MSYPRPGHIPAPKRLVPAKNMVGTQLPEGATAIIDALAGSYLGKTRSEVLRFIVLSWITEHHVCIKDFQTR